MRLDPVAGGTDPAIIARLPRLKADFQEAAKSPMSIGERIPRFEPDSPRHEAIRD